MAARYDESAAAAVAEVAAGEDFRSAAKAASLAGYLSESGAAAVLRTAVDHAHRVVRVAAAGALFRPAESDRAALGARLLDDSRPEIRVVALRSIDRAPAPALREQVARLAHEDSVDQVRLLAGSVAQRLG